jgi:succinate dehydrogenase / fumarate reductase flavoprotein subunit
LLLVQVLQVAAAATLAELGYNVKSFCFQDSPRRALSIAAQGELMLQIIKEMEIQLSVLRYCKGGDYRSRS